MLSLVEAQGFLLSADCIASIEDNEDICICASSKDIAGVDGDLVRNNWFRNWQKIIIILKVSKQQMNVPKIKSGLENSTIKEDGVVITLLLI